MFLFLRRQETTDCSNNLKLATQQIPSEAVLFKAGCVPELGRLVDDNILYVLGGLAAVAFMGRRKLWNISSLINIIMISFTRNIWHHVLALPLLRSQKNRRYESLVIISDLD